MEEDLDVAESFYYRSIEKDNSVALIPSGLMLVLLSLRKLRDKGVAEALGVAMDHAGAWVLSLGGLLLLYPCITCLLVRTIKKDS